MDPDGIGPRGTEDTAFSDTEYSPAREDAWDRAAQAWADARAEDDPDRRSALVDSALEHEAAWAWQRLQRDDDEASRVDAAP